MSGAVERFRDAINAAGLPVPDTINDDGRIHRFNTSGRRGDDSGWYVFYPDGLPAGAFGCWRLGLQSTWCALADNDMTEAQREDQRQRVRSIQAQRDADKLQQEQAAAVLAKRDWDKADRHADAHPYPQAKGVGSHGTRIAANGALLVPIRDTEGKLWNVERVNPQDFTDKRGLPGGRRKGCYHAIRKPTGSLVVCEGLATGASIHEATGYAVAMAFNAGNRMPVATALRKKYRAARCQRGPHQPLVICRCQVTDVCSPGSP